MHRHMLRHVPGHMLEHMPGHMLEHMPGHMLEHVLGLKIKPEKKKKNMTFFLMLALFSSERRVAFISAPLLGHRNSVRPPRACFQSVVIPI